MGGASPGRPLTAGRQRSEAAFVAGVSGAGGVRGALARSGRGSAPPCARQRGNLQTINQNSHSTWINKRGLANYKRHGTTTLFAALNALEGTVIGQCAPRHRHQEYLQFLDHLDGQTSADREVHLIVDNDATHKHRKVQAWFKKHPRFAVHYTPTSASWLNMVERFFRDLTVRRVRAGVFRSVAELEAAITDYIR